jgi:hypothetical protein
VTGHPEAIAQPRQAALMDWTIVCRHFETENQDAAQELL